MGVKVGSVALTPKIVEKALSAVNSCYDKAFAQLKAGTLPEGNIMEDLSHALERLEKVHKAVGGE